MRDALHNLTFLFDTGADVNILPKSFIGKHVSLKTSENLTAIDGHGIETYGTKKFILSFTSKLKFECEFLLADVDYGIIGANFMVTNGIDLLLSKRQIVHSGTNTLISSVTLVDKTTWTQSLNNLNLSNSEKCHQLLKQFPELLHDFDESHVVKHQMLVNVDTGDCKPILLRPRRFNPSRESAIDRTFENLIKQGIVEKSTSEWGFPVSIVGKPGKE